MSSGMLSIAAPIELERFAMGGQARRVARAGQRRIECQPTQTRPLVVQRRMDLGLAFERAPNSPARAWNRRRSADRHAAVDRITQELVLEVEDPAQPRRIEDEMVDELLEGSLDAPRAAGP